MHDRTCEHTCEDKVCDRQKQSCCSYEQEKVYCMTVGL